MAENIAVPVRMTMKLVVDRVTTKRTTPSSPRLTRIVISGPRQYSLRGRLRQKPVVELGSVRWLCHLWTIVLLQRHLYLRICNPELVRHAMLGISHGRRASAAYRS